MKNWGWLIRVGRAGSQFLILPFYFLILPGGSF